MRRIRSIALGSALASFLAASAAAAQEPPASGGRLVLGGGFGPGWARVSCDICARDRDLGLSGTLRIAKPIGPRLSLGGEGIGWTRTGGEDVREIVASAQGVAYYQPRPGGGLVLKAGAGWVGYRADDVGSNGLGVQVGAGYEFHAGSGFSLNNYVNLVASSFTSLKTAGNTLADGVSVTLFQFGVGVTRR
jgi:hypothetical protein